MTTTDQPRTATPSAAGEDVEGASGQPGPRDVLRAVRRRLLGGDRPYAVAFLAALALALVVVSGPVRTWVTQRDLVASREATLAALEAENDRLAARAEDLEDPDTVEEQAREELGMFREGEVPYVVVPPEVDQPRLRPERATEEPEEPGLWERVRQAIADVFG